MCAPSIRNMHWSEDLRDQLMEERLHRAIQQDEQNKKRERLHDLYLQLSGEGQTALSYLSGAYFSDLVTWYHLAWSGESERRRNPLLATLMSQGEGYDARDRQQLLASIGDLMSGLIPRWRALAARGQVELSSTPQTHPLSPLLLDFKAAQLDSADNG